MKYKRTTGSVCEQVRRQFELYADSEGSPSTFQGINDHLASCEQCSDWYRKQLRFESDLSDALQVSTPTDNIWDMVEESVRRSSHEPLRLNRWVVASAASLLVTLLAWIMIVSVNDDRGQLAQLAFSEHERLANGREPLQIASESDLEVEAFLKRRVAFPVRCPPRQDAGFHVQGGGICSLGTSSAAFVHGVIGKRKASIFILPREELSRFASEWNSLRNQDVLRHRSGQLGLVLGTIDKNLVIVVGQDSADELEKVLRAYGTYPDHETAT